MTSNLTRYIHTSSKLSAIVPLEIRELNTIIHNISNDEARVLAELARKKNIFARHGNNFYPQRIENLANRTVIERRFVGLHNAPIELVRREVSIIETIVLLSSSFNLTRGQFQKFLTVENKQNIDFDLLIGPSFNPIKTKSQKQYLYEGIQINNQFNGRFNSNSFVELTRYCLSDLEISARTLKALNWLLESRQEPSIDAAIVKTSIALESLLTFSDTESLTRSLSERSAYLLSSSSQTRIRISQIIKNFYGVRSGIVHGGRKKTESISTKLIESVDRIVLLICLILALNKQKWPSKDALQEWCELQKWGNSDDPIFTGFLRRRLTMAIRLATPRERN